MELPYWLVFYVGLPLVVIGLAYFIYRRRKAQPDGK